MNRKHASELAETITNEQINQMFNNAKVGVKDWTETSIVNKGVTKGVAWNVLAKNFDLEYNYHTLGKMNMIREFGEFLPSELKPKKKRKQQVTRPIHEEPCL